MTNARNWDITVLGVFWILSGVLDLLSVLSGPQQESPHGMLMASLGANSGVAVAYGATIGILGIIGGYGLIKVSDCFGLVS